MHQETVQKNNLISWFIWYLSWIMIQVTAYILSFFALYGLIYVFPVLTILGQYIVIRKHPFSAKERNWLLLLLIAPLWFVIFTNLWATWDRYFQYTVSIVFLLPPLQFVLQITAEIWLKNIFVDYKYGYWALGNIVATAIWFMLLWVHTTMIKSYGLSYWFKGDFGIFLIPLFTIPCNAIIAYFLNVGIATVQNVDDKSAF